MSFEPSSPSACYASGELPMRGDTIVHTDMAKPVYQQAHHPENDETWIVMTITDDMVRAKCERSARTKTSRIERSVTIRPATHTQVKYHDHG